MKRKFKATLKIKSASHYDFWTKDLMRFILMASIRCPRGFKIRMNVMNVSIFKDWYCIFSIADSNLYICLIISEMSPCYDEEKISGNLEN